jgi:hypothetical protein
MSKAVLSDAASPELSVASPSPSPLSTMALPLEPLRSAFQIKVSVPLRV